jgi:putative methionine-R-sulfoxide reductase with GAF domain
MYQFDIDTADKPALYRDLLHALDALTADEPDAIANMANAAALIWEYLPDLNWAGFYRTIGGELVLGPFQGKAACIRIPFGKGGSMRRIRRDARRWSPCSRRESPSVSARTPNRGRCAPRASTMPSGG